LTDTALRVALVYDDSLDRLSGVRQYVTTLGAELTRRGHEVVYLVGESSIDELSGVPVHSLSHNLSVRFNGNVLSMPVRSRRQAIERLAPGFDVVHVQVPFSPLMAGRVITALTPAQALVGTFHVFSEQYYARLGARLLAAATPRTLGRFDRFVAVSESAAEFARVAFRRQPVVVPNMVDVEGIAAMAYGARQGGVSQSSARVVYLGRLVTRKGVADLVRAFADVVAAHPSASLVIAGDGPERRPLTELVHRLGLRDVVRFVGTVGEAEKARLFRSAAIACFPSRCGESFGVVILEALAAGADAVVGGANRGYRDLLADTPTALVLPAELAEALTALLRDSSQRRDLRDRQRVLLERYDVRAVTDALLDLYREALRARRGSRAWPDLVASL
jgi:phosphatidylinositol alpha-mannosyltransferase